MRVDRSLGHARDVFAFGALVDAMLDLVREKGKLMSSLTGSDFIMVEYQGFEAHCGLH